MKKTLLSLAMTAALGFVSTSVLALNAFTDGGDVTINEGAIAGTPSDNNGLVVDQLNGNYTEIFSVTGPGTFNTLAYFNATGWTIGGSSPSSGQYLGGVGVAGYNLYALFQSNGTFSIDDNGTPGDLTDDTSSFVGLGGMLELYSDPDRNTDPKTLPSTANGKTISDITLGGITTDDKLLGSATLLTSANGHSYFGAQANGDFELIFGDWVLASPDGENYFASPRPFYMVLDLNGNFQSFDPTSLADTFIPQSVANAFFVKQVPEPATLALLGLGLVGLGMSRRRKS